jgi:hypothetical protein
MATTVTDVRQAFLRYAMAFESVTGQGRGTLALQHGSPTYGRAWRVFVGAHGAPGTSDRGWIGNNRREAVVSLDAMANTLWAIADTRRTGDDA